jgi:microcystin-dependent protein
MKYQFIFIIIIIVILIFCFYREKRENYPAESTNVLYVSGIDNIKNGKIEYTSDIGLTGLSVFNKSQHTGEVTLNKNLHIDDSLTAGSVKCLNDEYVSGSQELKNGKQTISGTQSLVGNEKIVGNTVVSNIIMNTSKKINIIPKGIIVMWNGTTVPDGWTLCDGNATGVPDLSNRFILADGILGSDNYQIGQKAGEKEVTLKLENIPSHTHSGGHTHVKTVTSFWGNSWTGKCRSVTGSWGNVEPKFATCQYEVKTGISGGDKPHNNMPPYYALAFIMKL